MRKKKHSWVEVHNDGRRKPYFKCLKCKSELKLDSQGYAKGDLETNCK